MRHTASFWTMRVHITCYARRNVSGRSLLIAFLDAGKAHPIVTEEETGTSVNGLAPCLSRV